ncbi:beta-ketoacyl synthase N-terminal-like domain-containing protein [Motilibacter deserti]|uniref:3-oxoacyl-[acyl-carrier-protein] synthase II n=1 Tax=Motilibacter deserti TaxID=2714956 RepID=A0ABX0H340_9ACTN|nr:beta-ketoacyl synthase N-terminal-like domain-containing protein [Motilibacter deserti]NHC16214.1 hypothetical protein [Motilibacter deserti]
MSEDRADAALAITGWAVVSPLGTGAADFSRGWRAQESVLCDVEGMYPEELPVAKACVLPGFNVRDHLGRKGTSCFDRPTSFTVVAAGLALDDTDADLSEEARGSTGIAMGTGGGTQSLCDFIQETIVNDPPYLVNPIRFPYAVMNAAAGSAAIWHRLRGVNATITDGQTSFLAALRYGRNQLRNGYERTMLVGGVEEFTPQRAWAAEHLRGGLDSRVPLGEGAAVFVLEPAAAAEGRPRCAEVLSVEIGASADGEPDPAVVAAVVSRALRVAGVEGSDIATVASSLAGSPRRDSAERSGILEALGADTASWLPVKDRLGETYTASGALQLAAVLAEHRASPELDGRHALVTSVTSDGLVGAAVVRGWSRAGDADGL